jgi:hypothetical protein
MYWGFDGMLTGMAVEGGTQVAQLRWGKPFSMFDANAGGKFYPSDKEREEIVALLGGFYPEVKPNWMHYITTVSKTGFYSGRVL